MNAVRKAVGIEKKQTVTDQLLDESCPKLSYNQRLTGYVLCMSVGFLLTIGSLVRLKALLHGDPAPFVIYFTFGNLCAIASCFFLSGPKSHCKKMVDRTRRIATAFYLITIFFTFFVVFYDKIPDDGRVGIIILCVFVQWIAMLWYTISFIPFARVRGVPRRLHAIDATRLQERRPRLVSVSISRPFGPRPRCPTQAGLGLHVLLPGAARLLQEARGGDKVQITFTYSLVVFGARPPSRRPAGAL